MSSRAAVASVAGLAVLLAGAVPTRADGCLTAAAAAASVPPSEDTAVGRLDGPDAQAVLDGINRVGDPTDLHAPTIVVVLHPTYAHVGLFNPCYTGGVRINLDAFQQVWYAVFGTKV